LFKKFILFDKFDKDVVFVCMTIGLDWSNINDQFKRFLFPVFYDFLFLQLTQDVPRNSSLAMSITSFFSFLLLHVSW